MDGRMMLDELLDTMETFIDARRRARLAKDSPAYEIKNWEAAATEAKGKVLVGFENYINYCIQERRA